MIVPAMGVVSEIIPVFAHRTIFGYKFIAFSSIGIAVFGSLVWAHHMFAAGMSMGFGTYLATKSEVEFHRRLVEQERNKIRHQHSKAEAELLFLLRQKVAHILTKHCHQLKK